MAGLDGDALEARIGEEALRQCGRAAEVGAHEVGVVREAPRAGFGVDDGRCVALVDEHDLVESAGERHDLSLRLVDATLCGALDAQPADAGPDPLDDAGRIGTPPEIVAQQLMDDTALGLRNDPLDELDAAFALEVEVDRTIRTTIGARARLVESGVGQGTPSQARDVVVALLDRVQDADIRVESAPDEPVDRRNPPKDGCQASTSTG